MHSRNLVCTLMHARLWWFVLLTCAITVHYIYLEDRHACIFIYSFNMSTSLFSSPLNAGGLNLDQQFFNMHQVTCCACT